MKQELDLYKEYLDAILEGNFDYADELEATLNSTDPNELSLEVDYDY